MLRFEVIFTLVELGLLIFALVDCISIYENRIRTLNKITWVFIIILIPIVGPVLWLVIGKDRTANRPAERARDARRPLAPDDDPNFLRSQDRISDQDARIRQLEAELKALNDEQDPEK
jgi:hypothetical protein